MCVIVYIGCHEMFIEDLYRYNEYWNFNLKNQENFSIYKLTAC